MYDDKGVKMLNASIFFVKRKISEKKMKIVQNHLWLNFHIFSGTIEYTWLLIWVLKNRQDVFYKNQFEFWKMYFNYFFVTMIGTNKKKFR